MTNSHIAEALAQASLTYGDPLLRRKTAEFISAFVRMMFYDGDPERPNCYEHYNPLTGKACEYRGVDDYQHSWVNDLIIKYVCGIRPQELTVTIDPFPFGLRSAVIDNVVVRERRLKVEIRGDAFDVWLDGKHHLGSRIGRPVELQI